MLVFMKKLQSDLKDGKHCAKSQTVSYLQVSLSSKCVGDGVMTASAFRSEGWSRPGLLQCQSILG